MPIPADSNDLPAASAYEQGALAGADPRCQPQFLQARPPVGQACRYPDYRDDEHAIWQQLYVKQTATVPELACQEFLRGLELLAFAEDRIPYLGDVDAVLKQETGWRVARIPGLLQERQFFELLAERIFPCTDYIRSKDELSYTPAPDLFHDIFGHTPMITDPAFARFYQRIGAAGASASDAALVPIQRLYWYTAEFGLIQTSAGLRVYGNGILSSFGECQYCLTDAVEKCPFDPQRIIDEEYDVWHMQRRLFVIESFEQLDQGFADWLARQ